MGSKKRVKKLLKKKGVRRFIAIILEQFDEERQLVWEKRIELDPKPYVAVVRLYWMNSVEGGKARIAVELGNPTYVYMPRSFEVGSVNRYPMNQVEAMAWVLDTWGEWTALAQVKLMEHIAKLQKA